jgi:hypothetical protein
MTKHVLKLAMTVVVIIITSREDEPCLVSVRQRLWGAAQSQGHLPPSCAVTLSGFILLREVLISSTLGFCVRVFRVHSTKNQSPGRKAGAVMV